MQWTAPFASATTQRATVHSFTGRRGPGFYRPQYADFSRYEGPPATPLQRQPLRMLPSSAQMRKTNTRFVSTAPRIAALNTGTSSFPGPGHYPHQQYSQFSPLQAANRIQPFTMQGGRSSIRDVFPDRRCGIICRPETTPAPGHYSPVPDLDKLRLSMRNPPCGVDRIRPAQGITLETQLASKANLASTLQRLR
jgi:hypothetical protein